MFKHGFPPEWSTFKKLIWLVGTGIAGASYIWKTVSGTLIHITDALASPVKELSVAIEPQQSGSGDPSPTNVRPITGWTGCEVWRTNTNRLTTPDEYGYYYVYIPKGSQICASASNSGKSVNYYRKDKSRIDYWSLSGSTSGRYYRGFSLSEDAYYWKFTDGTTEPQIEVGSLTPTEYKAPNGTTLSVTFPDTVYGGKYEFVGGSGNSNFASIDLGNLTWTKSTAGGDKYRFMADVPNLKIGSNVIGICSTYKKIATTYGAIEDGWTFHGTVARVLFFIDAFSDYTVDEFKTAMSGVQFVYELATPTEIQLTPQEISTLAGENNVWSNTNGDTTLIYKAQA